MSVLWQASGAGGVKSNPNLPGGDPYALPYGEAGQAVEDQRRRSLDAMAQAGTAGRQAVVDAQTQINQKKSEAVNLALQESRGRGADQAAQDVISSRVSQPYLTHSTGLDVGQAARAQDMAYRQAGDQQYFSNVAPAVQAGHDRMLGAYQRERARQDAERAAQQAQLEQQIAMAKYEAEQDRLAREWEQAQAIAEREWNQGFSEKKFGWEKDLAERKFQQDVEMAKLEASLRAKSGGGGGGGGGSAGYYNTGFTKGELKDQFPGLVSTIRKKVDPGNLMGSKLGKLTGFDKTLQSGVAGSAARSLGMPGSVGNALLGGKYSTGLRQTGQGMYDQQGRPITAEQPDNVAYDQTRNTIQDMKDAGTNPREIIRLARSSAMYGSNPTAVNRALSDAFPGLA